MNPLANSLKNKLQEKTAVIAVIGLGYVGLPLAVEKAKAGYKVIGLDVQQKRVNLVNKGINYIGDVVDSDLNEMVQSGYLRATTDYSEMPKADCIAICVPTPLDRYYQPDTSYVESSSRDVAKYLRPGTLVILESTTYPGTTEEIVQPILESTGMACGKEFFLAFSPERVDPGNKQYKTKNTPKVIGGVTPECSQLAQMLYSSVLDGDVHVVSSPKVAEMEKILENTFRNINIALANEMAILCNKMGIDVWEVIEAAKTKPYGFMAFYPGPGLGGHCIPIDPYYLTWKAREYDYHTRLIELAGEINQSMPQFVVDKAARLLNKVKKPLNSSKVLLLGAAYKKDIDDLRESPVLKIIDILQQEDADILYNDPYIPSFSHHGRNYTSVELTPKVLAEADIVIITTDHSNYDYPVIVAHSRLILDTRNACAGMESEKISKL
ncbi:MAG TPA: UDP-N-acetyl-D-glucosamine dehydrogenase [Firmicutes bacterium]|nr:UDP-N-acetyl-D-glucosamine dehydrogenase [Bacillota bacterium]HBS93307.1 UDP-N-acetyl-D-glucosamine dehydrogenase [Bacillota bacterium]